MGIDFCCNLYDLVMLLSQTAGFLQNFLLLKIAKGAEITHIELQILILYFALAGAFFYSLIVPCIREWNELPTLSWKDIAFAAVCGILRRENFSITTTFVEKVFGSFVIPIASALLEFFINQGPLTIQFTSMNKWAVVKAGIGIILNIAGSKNVAACFTNCIQMGNMNEEFSHTFTYGALMNFFGALGEMIYVVCRYPDRKYYNLQLNTKMGKLAFMIPIITVLGAGVRWCEKRKGTLFVARYSNLSLILGTILAPILAKLDGVRIKDKPIFYTLSVVTALLDILGALTFNWAKKKEAADDAAATISQTAGINSVVQPQANDSLITGEFRATGTNPDLHHGIQRTTDHHHGPGMNDQHEIIGVNNVLGNPVNHHHEIIEDADHHHHEIIEDGPDSHDHHETEMNDVSSQNNIIRGIEGTTDHDLHQGILMGRAADTHQGMEGGYQREIELSSHVLMANPDNQVGIEGADDHQHGPDMNDQHEITGMNNGLENPVNHHHEIIEDADDHHHEPNSHDHHETEMDDVSSQNNIIRGIEVTTEHHHGTERLHDNHETAVNNVLQNQHNAQLSALIHSLLKPVIHFVLDRPFKLYAGLFGLYPQTSTESSLLQTEDQNTSNTNQGLPSGNLQRQALEECIISMPPTTDAADDDHHHGTESCLDHQENAVTIDPERASEDSTSSTAVNWWPSAMGHIVPGRYIQEFTRFLTFVEGGWSTTYSTCRYFASFLPSRQLGPHNNSTDLEAN